MHSVGEEESHLEIYLFQLSTGTHHTAARQPVIHVNGLPYSGSLRLDISGNSLAILVRCPHNDTSSQQFVVYDWIAGVQKVVCMPLSSRILIPHYL